MEFCEFDGNILKEDGRYPAEGCIRNDLMVLKEENSNQYIQVH